MCLYCVYIYIIFVVVVDIHQLNAINRSNRGNLTKSLYIPMGPNEFVSFRFSGFNRKFSCVSRKVTKVMSNDCLLCHHDIKLEKRYNNQ